MGVYSLIVRNGIFRLRKVQIRAVPSSNRVDLLMLRNSVFRERNFEIWAVMSSNDVGFVAAQESPFQAAKRSEMAVPSERVLFS